MLRLAPAALGVLAASLAAGGAGGAAVGVLLVAVPIAASAALSEVGRMVEEEASWRSVAPAGASVLVIVLAAAARTPELALGCVVCLVVDRVVASAERATRKRSALSAARASR